MTPPSADWGGRLCRQSNTDRLHETQTAHTLGQGVMPHPPLHHSPASPSPENFCPPEKMRKPVEVAATLDAQEQVLEAKRAWRRANKDRNAAAARAYRARHPDRVREANRRYAEKNTEKVRALKAAWAERNEQRIRQLSRMAWRRRKARMRQDAEYLMRVTAYQRAYQQRRRKGIQTGVPSWLGGMLPSVSGQARIHFASAE